MGKTTIDLFFNYLREYAAHFYSVNIQERRLTYYNWTQIEFTYNFGEPSKVWTVRGFVQNVMAFFASFIGELDFAEVTVHVPDGFGAEFLFSLHNYIAKILGSPECSAGAGVQVRPVNYKLCLLYLFAHSENFVQSTNLEVSTHCFWPQLHVGDAQSAHILSYIV